MPLSDLCSFLDVPPPFSTPALHNPAPTIGRKPRPPMLQIPEITPPPLTPKPHPLFHQPRAPVAVQPAARAAGQPRRQRQPKIWDLLPTPKAPEAPEDSSNGFRPEPTPGFPRRPSDRSVKCYALHVRNRSLCGNQTGLQDSSTLEETADLKNESSAKPWTGITSPRQGFRAIGVPKVLENLPANFREAAIDSAVKFNEVKAVNAVQEAAGNGHFWKKQGGLSVSARFASSGVACNEAADGGESAPYSEASHSEPEARRWAATPQAPEIACRAAGIALQGRVLLASDAREIQQGRMQQERMQRERMQRERMQQRRRQFRAYREAPVCAADLNELLTAVLGIFSDVSSDKPSNSSWFWRLISDEEGEEQDWGEGEDGNAGQQGKAGSGRFGSPAGVLEYIGFDDDEDEEED